MPRVGVPLPAAALGLAAAPSTPAPTTPPIDIGPVSKAGGEWTVDWARAQRDATIALAKIDLTKRDIVLWVPGTSNHKIHPAFERAVRAAYGADVSLSIVDYEATWHMRRSTATGLATLLLLVDELRKRGLLAGKRLLIAGESQGAWIAGEAAAHPQLGRFVTRTALLGHPWLAANQFGDGANPRVQTINHTGDQVTLPVKGDLGIGLDAMIAIRTLQLKQIGTVIKGIGSNAAHGVMLLKNLIFAIPGLKRFYKDPHVYDLEMPDAVNFLRNGTRVPSERPARIAPPGS